MSEIVACPAQVVRVQSRSIWLAKHGVELGSITRKTTDDPSRNWPAASSRYSTSTRARRTPQAHLPRDAGERTARVLQRTNIRGCACRHSILFIIRANDPTESEWPRRACWCAWARGWVMRRSHGGACKAQRRASARQPAHHPSGQTQGRIPTLKTPTARGWQQVQSPVGAPGLKRPGHVVKP